MLSIPSAAQVEAEQTSPDGISGIRKWSLAAALSVMDHLQIEAALLPIRLRRESLLAGRLSCNQGRSKDLNVGNLITFDH